MIIAELLYFTSWNKALLKIRNVCLNRDFLDVKTQYFARTRSLRMLASLMFLQENFFLRVFAFLFYIISDDRSSHLLSIRVFAIVCWVSKSELYSIRAETWCFFRDRPLLSKIATFCTAIPRMTLDCKQFSRTFLRIWRHKTLSSFLWLGVCFSMTFVFFFKEVLFNLVFS